MCWGMCHAWEINAYIVGWEQLKERDEFWNLYLQSGNIKIDLEVVCYETSYLEDIGCVGGKGSFWTGYICHEGSGNETAGIFPISTIYRWTVSCMLQLHYFIGKSAMCSLDGSRLSWLWTCEPSLCRLSCGHPMHSHLLYQATTAHMMSITNQY
jgi:hypothetical protein